MWFIYAMAVGRKEVSIHETARMNTENRMQAKPVIKKEKCPHTV